MPANSGGPRHEKAPVRDDGSMVFELSIIINRELVRLLFGYAEGIKVLRPRKLVHLMRRHFQLGAELYDK